MLKDKTHLYTLLFATVFSIGALTSVQAADNTYKFESFENIDVDRSGYLETGEYQNYAFDKADWDNDGYLENTEWASYTETFYDPYEMDYEEMTYYDTNGDGFIDRSEFNETASGDLYEAWDYDNDDRVNSSDWDRVTAYYYDNE